ERFPASGLQLLEAWLTFQARCPSYFIRCFRLCVAKVRDGKGAALLVSERAKNAHNFARAAQRAFVRALKVQTHETRSSTNRRRGTIEPVPQILSPKGLPAHHFPQNKSTISTNNPK